MVLSRAKDKYAAQMQQKCVDIIMFCESAAAPRMSNSDIENVRDYARKISNIFAKY